MSAFSQAFLVTWLTAGIRLGGPVLLAALGETFAERSGILNLGIEGILLLGALASYLTSIHTGSLWLPLLAAMASGLAASLFLAWMYVTVRASQVVVGLVFNVLALGIAATVYRRTLAHASAGPIAMFQAVHIPWLSDLPILGPTIFSQTLPLYLTLVLVAVAHFALFHTRFGVGLRAAGENPRAADAAGVSVPRMRYFGTLLSGAAAGLAGGYLVLAQIGLFRDSIVAGQGFIALGIVIFGRWSPWKAALAAMVFGTCDALQLSLQLLGTHLPEDLLLSIPYVVTILAISGIFGGRDARPAALTVPYLKDA
ncbi:ABC transporter permease [Granulicella aggregans]|uniref:ABC transporter permease n=1 Tax=Granulicella aggregans TaxID=474949 RepID=UPI0021E0AD6F|nr:ABC transporter permease [Granulicella aggregans]